MAPGPDHDPNGTAGVIRIRGGGVFIKFCDIVETGLKHAGTVLFCVMIFAVSYEIVMRYVFNAPTFWSEALARYSMIWIVTFGLAIGIRRRQNIHVDFVARNLPGKVQPLLAWMRFLFVFAFAGALLVYGARHAAVNLNQMVTGLEIPAFYVYLCVPISGAAMILFTLELIIKGERGLF